MLRPHFLLCLIFFFSCADAAKEQIEAARNRLDNGKFAEAISLLDAVILAQPTNTVALNMRGVANFNLDKNSRALEDFSAAIGQDASNYQYYYNRGNVKRKLRDKEGAIADYSQAIALDSTHYEIFLNRALVLLNNSQPQQALLDFKKALTLSNGEDFRVYHYRGEAYLRLENYGLAEKDFRKCLSLDGSVAAAHLGLATSLIAQASTDRKEICQHIEKAISLGLTSAAEMSVQYCSE